MKVKVGDKVYDGDDEPVMVILSEQDKLNIANMAADATKYCMYPATAEWRLNNYEKIKEWMGDV
jgi:hypothetical protein